MRKDATFIVAHNKEGILLLKRGLDHPTHPGQWSLPGGKRDFVGLGRCEDVPIRDAHPGGYGESLDASAIDEFIEETGLVPKVMDKMPVFLVARQHIVYVYAVIEELPTDLPRAFPNREHTEYGWFNPDNLPEDTSDLVIELLSDHVSDYMSRRY